MKVAIIGLGNMGFPIAENIIRAGYELVVYNRTASKADELVELGAVRAETPAAAAQEADFVFTVLSDDSAVEAVVYGRNGILEGLKPGGIHVSISTISVELSKRLAASHRKHDQHFISSPVLGRPDAAAAAKLRLIVAGPEEARQKVKPLLEVLGQEVFEVGNEGHLANVFKLGNNFLIVSMLESLAESMVMVEKYGMEPTEFLETANALFGSPVYKNYGQLMAEGNFDPAGFKLKHGLKDVNLMLAAAEGVSASLPTGELIKEHYEKAVDNGWAELDWSALIKVFK